MITMTQSFTDVHGITHQSAVFKISNYSMNRSAQVSGNYDKESDSYTETDNTYTNLYYQAYYWTSEQAMLDDMDAMIYKDPVSKETHFSFSLESEPTDIVAACELDLSNRLAE